MKKVQNIKNKRQFALANGMSSQLVSSYAKSGWVFGVVDGKQAIFNPKHIKFIVDTEE